MLAIVLPVVLVSGAAAKAEDLPGRSDSVVVEPAVVVLGVTPSVTVSGTGFWDCAGEFRLRLELADNWRRSIPGHVLGETAARIAADGILNATIALKDEFFGEWTGFVVMEGGCLGDNRRLFGPVQLGLEFSDPRVAEVGIRPPEEPGVGAILIPGAFATNSEALDFEVWAPDDRCASSERTGNGTATVAFVGQREQPADCLAGGSVLRLASGRNGTDFLRNEVRLIPNVVQSVRPLAQPPGTSPAPPDAGQVAPTGESRTLSFAILAGAILVAAATVMVLRHRRIAVTPSPPPPSP